MAIALLERLGPPVWHEETSMGPDTFFNMNHNRRECKALFAELEQRWLCACSGIAGVRLENVKSGAGLVTGYNASSIYQEEADAFNRLNTRRVDHNLNMSAIALYTFFSCLL